jgi:hypothetical protein
MTMGKNDKQKGTSSTPAAAETAGANKTTREALEERMREIAREEIAAEKKNNPLAR